MISNKKKIVSCPRLFWNSDIAIWFLYVPVCVVMICLITVFQLSATPDQPHPGISLYKIIENDYIKLHDITSSFKIKSSFDFITQRGKLYRDDHSAIFSLGFSIIFLNGYIYKSTAEITRLQGEIMIPEDMAILIITRFNPGIKAVRKDGVYSFVVTSEGPKNVIKPDSPEKITFVVIDPGHGGKDPGAIGLGKVMEKDITMAIARHTFKNLDERLKGVHVILSRTGDVFVELGKRTEIANKLLKSGEFGLFLSIHVNASISRRISGFETYFLSQNPSNEDARNTAALENNVVVLEGDASRKSFEDVDYIEATMLTTQIQKESSYLAQCIQEGMALKNNRFRQNGVKKADFFVLRGVLMPAVLIEVGYITHAAEIQFLQKASYQQTIAEGIVEGVLKFINSYNSFLQGNKNLLIH